LSRKASKRCSSAARTFLLETALRADFALIHSSVADHLGNQTYLLTARNFNPIMAMTNYLVING